MRSKCGSNTIVLAADALVVAQALATTPAKILTSDPDDLTRLAEGQVGVEIEAL